MIFLVFISLHIFCWSVYDDDDDAPMTAVTMGSQHATAENTHNEIFVNFNCNCSAFVCGAVYFWPFRVAAAAVDV